MSGHIPGTASSPADKQGPAAAADTRRTAAAGRNQRGRREERALVPVDCCLLHP